VNGEGGGGRSEAYRAGALGFGGQGPGARGGGPGKQGDKLLIRCQRSISMCGEKEVKARVYPPDYSLV